MNANDVFSVIFKKKHLSPRYFLRVRSNAGTYLFIDYRKIED